MRWVNAQRCDGAAEVGPLIDLIDANSVSMQTWVKARSALWQINPDVGRNPWTTVVKKTGIRTSKQEQGVQETQWCDRNEAPCLQTLDNLHVTPSSGFIVHHGNHPNLEKKTDVGIFQWAISFGTLSPHGKLSREVTGKCMLLFSCVSCPSSLKKKSLKKPECTSPRQLEILGVIMLKRCSCAAPPARAPPCLFTALRLLDGHPKDKGTKLRPVEEVSQVLFYHLSFYNL